MPNVIKFNEPYLSGNEINYVNEVISNNSFAGNGAFTKKVQSHLSDICSTKHSLLTHSCTGALELSAMLLNIGPEDEVIVPSYTFVSTASAFLRNGAKIIFADIDPHSLMIDVSDIELKITEKTKAIVPVNYGGHSADILALKRICSSNDIYLIEDNAQGLGSHSFDKPLGTHGILGTLSFHETKNIHCGLGGALLINEDNLLNQAEDIWERGTNRTKMLKGLVDKYTWVSPGSSFYPSELQAAFLLAQLESMDDNIAYRKKLCDEYDAHLSILENSGILQRQSRNHTDKWNYHAMVIILSTNNLADKVRINLLSEGIHSYIGYVPLHSSPMGKLMGYSPLDLPVTESVAFRVLRLPLHHNMVIDDVRLVCESISKTLKEEII